MRIIHNIVYFFKRKYEQIRNLIKWFPVIWKIHDFDYRYAIDVFKFQLKNLADLLESENAHGVESKNDASRIRTAIKLIDKVYDDEYSMEYQEKLEEKYGKYEWEFIPVEDGKFFTVEKKWEKTYTPEELKIIEEEEHLLFLESHKKQERAENLLWRFISHNIRKWWD